MQPELARLVGAMGVEASTAGDVLQDVYLTACRKCPPRLDASELRRWLLRVTINRCNLEHRRRSRWRAVWHGLASLWGGRGRAATGVEFAQQDERRAVREGLARLDPQLRSLLVLRYFAELDSGEIGKILDLPSATVRGRLREARKRLAHELTRAGFGDD